MSLASSLALATAGFAILANKSIAGAGVCAIWSCNFHSAKLFLPINLAFCKRNLAIFSRVSRVSPSSPFSARYQEALKTFSLEARLVKLIKTGCCVVLIIAIMYFPSCPAAVALALAAAISSGVKPAKSEAESKNTAAFLRAVNNLLLYKVLKVANSSLIFFIFSLSASERLAPANSNCCK